MGADDLYMVARPYISYPTNFFRTFPGRVYLSDNVNVI